MVESYDGTCIFCKIINGEIPSSKVYEDDKVYAFLDINPINKGHTLVIPKKHSTDMLEDDDEDLKAVIHVSKNIAKAVMTAVNADGFNLGVNTKKAAGQVVFHTHFHIIPRFENDGLKNWPGKSYEEGQMKEVSELIIKELK
jgi:histidine triad (HIT) family protein